MIKVRFYAPYNEINENLMLYAVIIARYKNHWLFCKHKERTTYECPGGHREPGEPVDQKARRELYEETGATAFDIQRVCVYSVSEDPDTQDENFGMLYLARIKALGPLPEEFEMERVELFDVLPEHWTYPDIQPYLLKRAAKELEK